MRAWCYDCQSWIEVDDGVVQNDLNAPYVECEDVPIENCRGDDLRADDAYNDPRHEPYSNLKR